MSGGVYSASDLKVSLNYGTRDSKVITLPKEVDGRAKLIHAVAHELLYKPAQLDDFRLEAKLVDRDISVGEARELFSAKKAGTELYIDYTINSIGGSDDTFTYKVVIHNATTGSTTVKFEKLDALSDRVELTGLSATEISEMQTVVKVNEVFITFNEDSVGTLAPFLAEDTVSEVVIHTYHSTPELKRSISPTEGVAREIFHLSPEKMTEFVTDEETRSISPPALEAE